MPARGDLGWACEEGPIYSRRRGLRHLFKVLHLKSRKGLAFYLPTPKGGQAEDILLPLIRDMRNCQKEFRSLSQYSATTENTNLSEEQDFISLNIGNEYGGDCRANKKLSKKGAMDGKTERKGGTSKINHEAPDDKSGLPGMTVTEGMLGKNQ